MRYWINQLVIFLALICGAEAQSLNSWKGFRRHSTGHKESSPSSSGCYDSIPTFKQESIERKSIKRKPLSTPQEDDQKASS